MGPFRAPCPIPARGSAPLLRVTREPEGARTLLPGTDAFPLPGPRARVAVLGQRRVTEPRSIPTRGVPALRRRARSSAAPAAASRVPACDTGTERGARSPSDPTEPCGAAAVPRGRLGSGCSPPAGCERGFRALSRSDRRSQRPSAAIRSRSPAPCGMAPAAAVL